MGPEVLQFLVMIAVFIMAGLLWVGIVYRPGRTLEHWEGDRVRPDANHTPGRSEPPDRE